MDASAVVKRLLAPLVHRYPSPGLGPARLYAFLDALRRRTEIEGAVLEVGCWMCGTTSIAYRFLDQIGRPRRYVCVDTFGGFVADQFDHDAGAGLPQRYRSFFAANSLATVRRLAPRYGIEDVELIAADIVTLAADRLPARIAVCLVDVDLEIPVHEALVKIHPRMAPGGVILIDDCGEVTDWTGARRGYRRFVAANGLPERYEFGFGTIET